MEGLFGGEIFKDMGFGGVLGFLVGFTLKRVLRLFALFLGLYILSLVWLADNGVIVVKWGEVAKFVGGFFSSLEGFIRNLVRTISFGGSFLVGFGIGMKV